ncbi:hypothetical protein N505_0123940 [Rhodococcus aetherivorans]|nr:hypothetical protein N505_0123940 [Rhodococcus aetherivorans]
MPGAAAAASCSASCFASASRRPIRAANADWKFSRAVTAATGRRTRARTRRPPRVSTTVRTVVSSL